MTYEEKKRLIEAAKMIKDFCDERCEDVECPFLREYGCGINDTETPKYWHIPEPKRWSREDVALAKALKDAGAEVIYKSDGKVSLRTYNIYDYGLLPDTVFKNMLSGESIDIDDIIKESEENE